MNMISMFNTPLWSSDIPNFETMKPHVISCVKEIEENYPNVEQTNYINGYQSPQKTLQKNEKVFPLLDYAIEVAVKATIDLSFVSCQCFIADTWANVSKSRGSVLFDTMERETFTAIAFIKSSDASGDLVIKNPSISSAWRGLHLVQHKTKDNSEKVKIEQREGTLMLFPSYLPYSIEPNKDDEETICLVMSIVVVPKELLNQSDT